MGWTNTAGGVLQVITVIITGGTPDSGLFVYSGPPAFGNLIASISAVTGTDAFGNQFGSGFVSYDQTNFDFSQLDAGAIIFGPLAGGAGTLPNPVRAGALTTDTVASGVLTAGETKVKSRNTSDRPLSAFLKLISGSPGFGSVANAHGIIGDAGQPADLYVTGALVKSTDGLTPDVWQVPGVAGVPAFNANWSGSTTFNGTANWGTFQYRKMGEDNIWLLGGFKAAAGAGAAILTLPAAFRPTQQWPIWIQRNNAGTLSAFNGEVGPSGNFNILAGSGGGIAAGNEYLVNAFFPLGDVA